jgi:flagellin-like hook-associated protein FlgL
MSDIVLTSAVRQNLLSLQQTADLLSTTQNHLASGKKVNSALDNPTNYFTAASLDARSGDLTALLDGIGNGVQVLQAANTGITALQGYIDTAKSIANSALQAQVGYSPKSLITTPPLPGAIATNILGTPTTPPTNAVVPGVSVQNNLTAAAAITGGTLLQTATNADTLRTPGFGVGDTLSVNGVTIHIVASGAVSPDVNVTGTVQNLLDAIDSITGAATATPSTPSSVIGGKVTLNTGVTSDLQITGSPGALNVLGLAAINGVNQPRTPGPTPLGGLTLQIGATGGGSPTSLTFGTGVGQISSIQQLNAALASNNLISSIDASGRITISTNSDAASATLGGTTAPPISGTATGALKLFNGLVPTAPTPDPVAQSTRAALVNQYNTIIQNITTTSQDASFNGVNLLTGDTLKMVFDETGKSFLNIVGVNFTPAGLGLSGLTGGIDFVDNGTTQQVLTALNAASTTLRTEASSLGSNLSIVQIRQSFSKNLINVLQTGSANLTLADSNEEAANSQALSTRQSISVSALALANQSQQSVLQLLQR